MELETPLLMILANKTFSFNVTLWANFKLIGLTLNCIFSSGRIIAKLRLGSLHG